jgi:gluconolactonase
MSRFISGMAALISICFSAASCQQTGQAVNAVEIIDPQFADVASPDAILTEIAGDCQFTEGPVWIDSAGAQGYLLFSDIPADRIYRWSKGAPITVWREPSGNSNGLLQDSGGQLLACEHGNRRVSVTKADGKVEVLCDSFRGKKLNSPNDASVGRDGSIWFTDPSYGLEGRAQEQAGQYVFRMLPGRKEPQLMVDNFDMPNGIVFSPDKKMLYIADSGEPHHIRSFSVTGDSLRENGVFAVISPGGPDGIRVDKDGRLYAACGDGVQVFSPAGKLLGKILTPVTPTNCAFGGDQDRSLFITARQKAYVIQLKTSGLR